jgi:hypothetical protein
LDHHRFQPPGTARHAGQLHSRQTTTCPCRSEIGQIFHTAAPSGQDPLIARQRPGPAGEVWCSAERGPPNIYAALSAVQGIRNCRDGSVPSLADTGLGTGSLAAMASPRPWLVAPGFLPGAG